MADALEFQKALAAESLKPSPFFWLLESIPIAVYGIWVPHISEQYMERCWNIMETRGI